MKGIEFDATDGRITIVNGARTVATTDGTLINLLPDEVSIDDETATFPDFDKDSTYVWIWREDFLSVTPPVRYGWVSTCASFVAALPQEYSYTTTLMDAPAGADFFIGMVRVNRTTAPSHTWMDATIDPPVSEGEWVPWAGSMLIESDINFCRALHIYIDDDPLSATYRKFVMRVQQSVGPPDGGYDTAIPEGSGTGGNHSGGSIVNGGNTATGARNGFSVWQRDGKTDSATNTSTSGINRHKWNGSDPCARTDPTNYVSVYSVDIRGRFGRRS
jgi:hypothetical protein